MRLLLIVLVALTSLGVALEMKVQRKAWTARSSADPMAMVHPRTAAEPAPAAMIPRATTKRSKTSAKKIPATRPAGKNKNASGNLKIKHPPPPSPSPPSSFDGVRL